LRTLKEEASTIKLWLACVANNLKRVEMPCDGSSNVDTTGLFGPYSPMRHLAIPLSFASFMDACTTSKSYDTSSLRRSSRIAQRKMLKGLSIIGKDRKLDEGIIQEYANCLKESLQPDLLESLVNLCVHAF
ncbi:hypothetical protein BAE44_0003601, partial [Dichanthelium oligosanthes]